MTARAEGKHYNSWRSQNILITDPPITSLAAYVLLVKLYHSQDRTIYRESRMTRIRNAWMKRQMKTPDEKGGLTCALCGRKGLNPHTKDKNKLATLDHIVELRMGGPWREPSNFQVACYTCNCRRSSTKS